MHKGVPGLFFFDANRDKRLALRQSRSLSTHLDIGIFTQESILEVKNPNGSIPFVNEVPIDSWGLPS
jgi:hypothetical protein